MFPDPVSGIRERLDNLIAEVRRPHWSVTPSFWLLVSSVVISIAALVLAVLGLPQAQSPAAAIAPSMQTIQPVSGTSPSSQLPLVHLPPTQADTTKK